MKNVPLHVSSTSLGRPFIDAFASGLSSKFAEPNSVWLSKITIILPSESARVDLVETLATRTSGSALLLPRVYVFNDNLPSQSPREQTDLGRLLPPTHFPSQTPIPETQRKFLLAALIQQWRKADRESNLQSFKQALKTASSLAEFIDELHAANLDYSCMDNLRIRKHASHWGGIDKFLTILSEQWPIILDEKTLKDPLRYDADIAQNLVEYWKKNPPTNTIIAAGFIGNLPYVTDFLATVSRLTIGHVVVPNLDCNIPEKLWVNLPEQHPQYSLKRLLEYLRVEYKNVSKWPDSQHSPCPPQRQQVLQTATWPTETSHTPKPELNLSEDALSGLMPIICHDTSQESKVIALIIKNFLDKREGNVAIVTSDTQLLKKIAAELRRWKLNIRQPIQRNIQETQVAIFLQLVANMICLNASPVSLLSALKHPMCKGNNSSKVFSKIVKELEHRCLRGIRPEPGFLGIMSSLRATSEQDKRLLKWLGDVNIASRQFSSLISRHNVSLRDLLAAHLDFVAWLCHDGTEEISKNTKPWLEKDNKAAYQHLVSLTSCLDNSLVVDGKEYADIFPILISTTFIGVQNFENSRILAYSPEHSVFRSAGLNILAGMNKEFWPTESSARSWMSAPMRQSMGLPSLEFLMGVSNFKFCQCFTASQVVLTRSEKRNGVGTKPSDSFMRLKTTLEKTKLHNVVDRSSYWNSLAQSLDYVSPNTVKIQRPAPRPPCSARPRSLSATQIEQWMHDPYSIYASTVLRLKKLRPVDATLQPADYGRMVHTALERFVKHYPTALPNNAFQELLRFGKIAFRPVRSRPEVFSFWWSRFERSAAYFVEEEKKNRPHHTSSHAEVHGSINISLPQGEFRLTAKADRINLRLDGAVDIIDYKTGSHATSLQILKGTKPQLLIEAVIALYGNYTNIETDRLNSLVSLRLNDGSSAGKYQFLEEDIPLRANRFLTKLRELMLAFDDEQTAYNFIPSNEFASQYNDFLHLARMNEWLLGSGITNTKP